MKRQLSIIVVFTVAVVAMSQATLTWNGADGAAFFTESNWLDNTGAVPADGTINGGTAITADTGGLIKIDSSSPGNIGSHLLLGQGNQLLIDNGQSLTAGGSRGIRVDGSLNAPLSTATIDNGSLIFVQFLVNIAAELNHGSTLRLKGGGNPVNVSTINLLDTDSMILFNAETYAAFNTEHSSKVTYNGAALEFGSDPFVAEAGDNALATAYNGTKGVQITVIPEPASFGLMALLGGSLLFIRRWRTC
jgi:hypothetical protein